MVQAAAPGGAVMRTSAQFCQIWSVCSQSHLHESTYSPSFAGTFTWSTIE